MNCHAAKTWLLAAKRSDRLPPRIVRHLVECPPCRKLRIDLLQTEELTARFLMIPDNPSARAALERKLDGESRDQSPHPTAAVPRRSSMPRRFSRASLWTVAVSAAMLILCLGWLIGRYSATTSLSVSEVRVRKVPENNRPWPPEEKTTPILVRVASLASRMVSDRDPSARLDVLESLADELRSEGLRLAARGQVSDLARLTALHDRVLRSGLAPQVQRLADPKDRDAAVARLSRKMDRIVEEVTIRERSLPPSVAERLKPFVTAARATSQNLAAAKMPDIPPGPEPANPPPLDGLVTLVVKLAHEDAPLPRAEASADLGKVLAQATVLLTVSGDTEFSSQMGEYLDTVMANGVADNLDSVEAEDMKGNLKQEVAKVRERAGEVGIVLQRDLEKAPPAAQQGLQQAIEASRDGQERAAKGGKGKGPPWNRKDKFPPGWQKKM